MGYYWFKSVSCNSTSQVFMDGNSSERVGLDFVRERDRNNAEDSVSGSNEPTKTFPSPFIKINAQGSQSKQQSRRSNYLILGRARDL
jgi:hypothetical protein